MYGSTADFVSLDLGDVRPAPSRNRKSGWLLPTLRKMAYTRLGLSLCLLGCLGTIVYQRLSILQLQNKLSDSVARGKRSLREYREENDVRDEYLTVHSEMTKSQLRRLCEKHSFALSASNLTPKKKHQHVERKHCSTEFSFGERTLVAKRSNTVGAAVRDGDRWFLTEFHLGYTVLVYHNDSTLASSLPSRIATLPYPFHGTDGTVHNRTVVYLFGESLIAYNTVTKSTRHHALNASLEPLYVDSNSRVDAAADEHGLWVLFKERGQDILTAVRLHLKNLKELNRWKLSVLDPSDWCNAFIRCGVLFSATCHNRTMSVRPAFDFYRNEVVNGEPHEWPLDGHLSSVQYDTVSKTLNVFDEGSVYSTKLIQKRM